MDRFLSSAVTVGKVILVAVVGMWASRYFVSKSKSLAALSHIAVKIFLPCLLLTQLAHDISWEMIRKYYWACILPLIPMVIGLSSAFAFRSFIPKELHGLLQLACTFQNVISYGLGIAVNLNISWYDKEAATEAQSYVFLYNVVHSLFLWSVGTMIVEKCAEALEEKDVVLETSTTTNTHTNTTNTNTNSNTTNTTTTTTTITTDTTTDTRDTTSMNVDKKEEKNGEISSTQSYMNSINSLNYNPVTRLEDYRPVIASTTNTGKRRVKRSEELTWSEYICLQLSYLMTEQLIASLIGLLIALVPPFGMLVDNRLGEMILGGFSLLAPGTVPLQLLVLGVNITADGDGSVKLPTRFLVAVIILRLFFIPLVCFGIVHILVVNALIEYNRPFILIMLILTCAPTAINTSIICSMYSYKVKEYTKLLLYMYITCIFTTTVWLTIYIWYLET
ncbi:putative transporter [Trypanosoma theileri]|uniref:Putative transporter n=1 Tax=Trypanosoma theileri TaxID=67003 RepID=A0A1X0P681_9TRYP|nr:putative transporter [Trypanosoma theileri]ORC92454.1 putative transporter [Trypanosoma theileri]